MGLTDYLPPARNGNQTSLGGKTLSGEARAPSRKVLGRESADRSLMAAERKSAGAFPFNIRQVQKLDVG